ncbi:MAG: alpha/beta hydrolase [Lachnospiraceae bacterium]|nr:alpha/beta hydrolase [Lachnospiraceae bacterium]
MKRNSNTVLPLKIAAVFSLAGLSFLYFAWPFFRFIVYAGEKKSPERKVNQKKWGALKHTSLNHPRNGFEEEYNFTRNWCEKQPMQNWYINSRDGLNLHASYYPVEGAKRFVILCHGYKGTRFGSVAHIARFLREEKCSLLFIDERCCGESEGTYITFGAREQYDILGWVSRLNEENTDNLPIYIYGQSMGATSALLSSGHIEDEFKLPKEVKGIIADCGFSSMKKQLRDIATDWFHLNWIELLLLRVDLFCRLFAGFSMKETDTEEALGNNTRPILYFHGSEDTYVRPQNTAVNYERTRAPKEMVMINNARHLCCSYVEPVLYREKISEFFEKYDGTK